MQYIAFTVFLGLLTVVRAAPPCVSYCNITPNNRTLCPQTDSNRPPNRVDSTTRLASLRLAMKDDSVTGNGEIDAYLVFESSYYGGGVTEHNRRILWISGFSGSAGYIIVSTNRASLWTDGRYFLQGDQEPDCNWNLMKQSVPRYPNGSDWLKDVLESGAKVGAHKGSMAASTWQTYEAELERAGIELVATPADLFDSIWTLNRPPRPNNEIYVHDMKYAGKTWQDKVAEVRKAADLPNKADVILLTVLDDIAWLFNLRGSDRLVSPLFDSAAMIMDGELRLYLNNFETLLAKNNVQSHLNTAPTGICTTGGSELCVNVRELSTLSSDLQSLSTNNRIWVDAGVSYDVYEATGINRTVRATPVALIKAQKNPIERAEYKKCQLRDSATVVEFMAMLEKQVVEGKEWTEVSASDEINNMRAKDPLYRMLSFEPIAGSGPNGAVIHYRATAATDRRLTMDEVFLLDSGGNYLDGTTDVTRTFFFGDSPPDKVKEAYTRVLMGVIDLATTVWPQGWKGSDLDARTRVPLWQNGWDYNHGTGHGIGMFLNVHEGPGRISLGYNAAHSALYPGMFFSDEPGFYEDNEFGIRLETIVEVQKIELPNRFNDKDYLTFYPHTVVPFEPKMIKYDLLETHHRHWLNTYHTRCLEETGAYVRDVRNNQAAYDWIVEKTEQIPEVPGWVSGSTQVTYSLSVLTFALTGFIITHVKHFRY